VEFGDALEGTGNWKTKKSKKKTRGLVVENQKLPDFRIAAEEQNKDSALRFEIRARQSCCGRSGVSIPGGRVGVGESEAGRPPKKGQVSSGSTKKRRPSEKRRFDEGSSKKRECEDQSMKGD